MRLFFIVIICLSQIKCLRLVHTLTMKVANGVLELFLRLSGASKTISEKTFYKKMRKNAVKTVKGKDRLPLFLGVFMEKGVYCGMRYFCFIPPQVDTAKSILYLHGSAYVDLYCGVQIKFVASLAKNTHAKVYFPLYPKLPFSTVLPCFALLNNFFAFLKKKGEVLLMGDSSGAALALSLAEAQQSIDFVVAISPWLRLFLGEEERRVKTDLMLSFSKLSYVANLWSGGVKRTDNRVSPIYGDYGGKTILLFAGEFEMFRPLAELFTAQQRVKGATIRYIEGERQQHCYPLLPTAEGERARKIIYQEMRFRLYGEGK